MKISAEENRARVKKTMQSRDRVSVILPKGTADRIHAAGFKSCAGFAKTLILAELDKIESLGNMHKKNGEN